MHFFSLLISSRKSCEKSAGTSGEGNKYIKRRSNYRGVGICTTFFKCRPYQNHCGEQQSGYQSAYNATAFSSSNAANQGGNIQSGKDGGFSITKEIKAEDRKNNSRILDLFRDTSSKISDDVSKALNID